MKNSSILLSEIKVKNYLFKNRYVCAPFDISRADNEGLVTDELLDIYKKRRGPSLIVVEQAAVSSNGMYRKGLLRVDKDRCIEGLSKLAQVIHNNNQVAVLQINHAGSAADVDVTHMEAVAPSAVVNPVVNKSMPRELSINEIGKIKEEFVKAAIRAKNAGFDGVEIQNCHGFLLSQFLSPITNKRKDEYGESLKNRSRLLLEIVGETRKALGDDLLLLVRLGADDLMEGGLKVEDGSKVAKMLEENGVDILDLSSGLMPPLVLKGPAMLRPMIKTIKSSVNIPVIGAGELDDVQIASDMIDKNEVDFIGLGRPIMNQPDFVERLIEKIKNTTN